MFISAPVMVAETGGPDVARRSGGLRLLGSGHRGLALRLQLPPGLLLYPFVSARSLLDVRPVVVTAGVLSLPRALGGFTGVAILI